VLVQADLPLDVAVTAHRLDRAEFAAVEVEFAQVQAARDDAGEIIEGPFGRDVRRAFPMAQRRKIGGWAERYYAYQGITFG
jgi:hypothetical protein